MLQLLTFSRKKKEPTKNVIFTENSVRDEIMRRAMVNQTAKNEVIKLKSKATEAPKPAPMTTANSYATAITKLNGILDKVAGYENSKITAVTELLLALESGDDKNLIKFLKTKDKVVKIKVKKY